MRITQKAALLLICFSISAAVLFTSITAFAYGECSQYGYMATYDYLSDSCKCMSGYVFGKDVLGDTTCVSADSVCRDKLGYSSRYNSTSESCECSYGNVIDNGRCTDGDTVCHRKHGYHSSYDNIDSCKCDTGYTFDDSNQCVEKKNNVYFKLLDLDTDNKLAIIKSDYDSRKYLITYGTGCYAAAFQRYLNKKIVVNLGTDFDVDRYDQIVLQDDYETCDIRQRERTYEDALPREEVDEDISTYIPTYSYPTTQVTPVVKPPVIKTPPVATNENFEVASADIGSVEMSGHLISAAAFRQCPSTKCSIYNTYAKGLTVQITGEYMQGSWYQISGTDANGAEKPLKGWIHKSLIQLDDPIEQSEASSTSGFDFSKFGEPVQQKATTTERVVKLPESEPFYVRIWLTIVSWFH